MLLRQFFRQRKGKTMRPIVYRLTFVCLSAVFILTACGAIGNNLAVSNQSSDSVSTNSQQTTSTSTGVTSKSNSEQTSTSNSTTSRSDNVQSTDPSSSHTSHTAHAQRVTGLLKIIFSCSGTGTDDGIIITNSQAKACAYTLPGATMTISVRFCNSQPDSSSVLQGSVVADANGYYEWDWTPHANCNGQANWGWNATVTARLNGSVAQVSHAVSKSGSVAGSGVDTGINWSDVGINQ